MVALYHYNEAERLAGPAVIGESVLLQVSALAGHGLGLVGRALAVTGEGACKDCDVMAGAHVQGCIVEAETRSLWPHPYGQLARGWHTGYQAELLASNTDSTDK